MTKLRALIFLFIHAIFALSSATEASPKTEVEFKINLTQNGYSELRKVIQNKFEGETSERTDIYFDIFKDKGYILKKSSPPIKLRFQTSKDIFKWQTQQTVGQDSFGIFSMKKTQSISMEIDEDIDLVNSFEHYHDLLLERNPESLKVAERIENILDTEGIFNFTRTLCVLCTKESKYYSTHINHKKRIKMKLKILDDSFTIQVGETNNNGLVTYELEAEVKKLTNLNLSAQRLHTWLTAQGMTEVFIDHFPSIDPTRASEMALQELHSF